MNEWNDISDLQSILTNVLYNLNSDELKKFKYELDHVCPADIVEVMESNPDFDEWIYSSICPKDYTCHMFIIGDKHIVAKFNFWYGTVTIEQDE